MGSLAGADDCSGRSAKLVARPSGHRAKERQTSAAGAAVGCRCDGAVFIPGWTASSGSKAEHAAARELGIDVLEVTVTSVLEPWVARLRKTERSR